MFMTSRSRMNSYLAAVGAALSFVLLPGAALSQSTTMGDTGAASSTAQSIDDATLHQAAKAYVAVRHIATDTKQRLARTSDSAERQQISAQAEAQKLDVVREVGMQPREYNKVILMVQNDPGLQQKFLSYVNAEGGV